MVGKREGRQAELGVGRNTDVNGAKGFSVQILRGVVRSGKDLVEIAAARATAVIKADLTEQVPATGA